MFPPSREIYRECSFNQCLSIWLLLLLDHGLGHGSEVYHITYYINSQIIDPRIHDANRCFNLSLLTKDFANPIIFSGIWTMRPVKSKRINHYGQPRSTGAKGNGQGQTRIGSALPWFKAQTVTDCHGLQCKSGQSSWLAFGASPRSPPLGSATIILRQAPHETVRSIFYAGSLTIPHIQVAFLPDENKQAF